MATSSIRNDPPNPRHKDLRDTDLHEHDSHDKLAARIAIVEQHVRLENAHVSKAFSAPSATPRATTTSPGANTSTDATESANSTSN